MPDFIDYWSNVGPEIFFRVFWFFFFIEFVRYVLLDFIVAFYFLLFKKRRERQEAVGREMLFAQRPLVSVIVPGKNEGKNLFKLVKSLKEQTYSNYEVIVVDDGSDDDTPIIGKSLEDQGLITTFIRNPIRGGKASAANLAYRLSKGKYIVHVDADSSLDRTALEAILLPFYTDPETGAVGGNVKVSNVKKNLVTRFQAFEYLKTISIGRIVTSTLGIYKVVSGAFGAFRRDVLDQIGGWDVGPGLDGDITMKIRKSGYHVHFAHKAVCLTNVPESFKKLTNQRLRWNKSLIRFRIRKHFDVYMPNKHFNMRNFLAVLENIVFNIVMDVIWFVYLIDMVFNFRGDLDYIIYMNFFLYMIKNFVQLGVIYLFSERSNEDVQLWSVIPFVSFYTGWYLRIVRTIAYYKEIFFKRSYEDSWNPQKTSLQALKQNI